jgi:two-component system, NarL family, nitrate/nitrite response regulator NarL
MAGVSPRAGEPTVLLADDQAAIRVGLRQVLEADGLQIVAEASSAVEAVQAAVEHRPDVCLLAVGMRGSGIFAAAQIAERVPDSKVVMLSASDLEEDLFRALRAGAVGYLPKATLAARLPHIVRGVARGEAALPRELTGHVLRELRESGQRRRLSPSFSEDGIELTPREFEVMELFRRRKPTSDIAAELRISEVTARRHISAILHKLGAPDRRTAFKLLDRRQPDTGADLDHR